MNEIKILGKPNSLLDIWDISIDLDSTPLITEIDNNGEYIFHSGEGIRSGCSLPADVNYKVTEILIRFIYEFFVQNRDYLTGKYPEILNSNTELLDCLSNTVQPGNLLFKDSPKFKMNPHYDSRFTIGTLLINLKDNANGTFFHEDPDLNYTTSNFDTTLPVFYESTNMKGKGVFILNSERSFHSVENRGNSDRYMLSIVYSLKTNID